jgi:tight adherence protein C
VSTSLTFLMVGGGLFAAVGAFLAVLAFRPSAPSGTDLLVERLDAYQAVDRPMNLDEVEASLSFRERILLPSFRGLAAMLARRRPDAAQAELQRTLNLAGRPLGLSAGEYLAVRYVTAALGAVGGALFGVVMGNPALILFGLALGAVVGLMAPRYILAARVKGARKKIQLSLPDAMDLMSVCVEAGLTFEGAMAKVADRYDNQLGSEFTQVLRELRLGRSRRDAMADLGVRTGVNEVHSFAQAVIQSDVLGTGIARVLRLQSDELRRRRRQRAQEQGAKAGLKILFPMVIFIFPSLWIVLLGPAGLLLLQEFSSH